MQDDVIKGLLYGEIRRVGEQRVRSSVLCGGGGKIVDDIFFKAAESLPAETLAKSGRAETVLVTGLLHYLLTVCMIPSQRKVPYNSGEIDVVLPDMRVLEADPKGALVIMIATMEGRRIYDVSTLQPNAENVWIVSTCPVPRYRTFVVGRRHGAGSLAEVVRSAAAFFEKRGGARLKIHGVR